MTKIAYCREHKEPFILAIGENVFPPATHGLHTNIAIVEIPEKYNEILSIYGDKLPEYILNNYRFLMPVAPHNLLRATATLSPYTISITSSIWQVLGGIAASVGEIAVSVPSAFGYIAGQWKADGGTALLRITATPDGDTPFPVSQEVIIPDTQDQWVHFYMTTNTLLPASRSLYEIQGRTDTALSASLRYVTISLMEVV